MLFSVLLAFSSHKRFVRRCAAIESGSSAQTPNRQNMTQVLGSSVRLVSYAAGMQYLLRRLSAARLFSTHRTWGPDQLDMAMAASHSGVQTVWPDERMGPFGMCDSRFKLPGNVGFASQLHDTEACSKPSLPDILSQPMAHDRQSLFLSQVICESQNAETSASVTAKPKSDDQFFEVGSVECLVQNCPDLLHRDFIAMFPEAPRSPVTVVTVTQKTNHNMSVWSEEVQEEREKMLDNFIDGAKEICFALRAEGYWADFIDPSSGLAFFGAYTNSTMFETDDRYSHLGFQVEDLGCCKVIRHPLWGRHVFVGSLFTTAPPECPLVQHLSEPQSS
uniref:cobalamin trafficking protein CblD isoform X2 n=1 Tax=Myxine glutinosa TaxID=7769 RepID=UPI00358EFD08